MWPGSSSEAVAPGRRVAERRAYRQGMGWDPRAERSACGIGFVADASGLESRRVVELGIEALRRLEHRGAAAGDGVTGDGAGMLLPIPRDLLGDELGLSDDERRSIGVAMVFARGEAERRLPALLEKACAPEGMQTLEVRKVPVEPAALGPAAVGSMPTILQVVIGPAPGRVEQPTVAQQHPPAPRTRHRRRRSRRVRGLTRLPHRHVQGARAGEPARRLLPGPARRAVPRVVRDLPSAVLDEHVARMGAGAAVPRALP